MDFLDLAGRDAMPCELGFILVVKEQCGEVNRSHVVHHVMDLLDIVSYTLSDKSSTRGQSSHMQQEFLILADAAEAANGKIFIHGGGVDRHSVLPDDKPPLNLKADIALGVLTDWTETNRTHVLGLTIYTEDAKAVWKIEGQFEVGRPPGAKPGQQFRQLIAIKGPIALPDRGAFKIVLELDGKEQGPPFRFWVEDLSMGTANPQSN